MDSPIIPMIKRAFNTPDDHSLQAVKISDSQEAMRTIANVTTNFWREGIPVTHWNFLPSRKSTFKQSWLPPYQFQPTPHWLKDADRATEAEKNAAVEKTIVVEKPQEPKAPSKLVNVGKGVGKNDRSREFDIFLGTQRFTKIVSGHAVRQRALCPASLYMECAAMGLQLLQGEMGAGSLGFRDLVFQAALGVDLTRVASLTLEKADDAQSWRFEIKSSSKADPKSRSSTHTKGRIVLSPEPNFRRYERLISCSGKELESKPNTEKLMCNRDYGLFSQVVHYADFLQGISHITMSETEVRANIDLSDDAKFGLEESTVIQYCDTVAIDTFIRVVGLLINSSNLVTSEDVYVATGVDNVSMSSTCDFNKHRSWTVYTKYTSTGEGQAPGDIFVMTRAGTLAMIITGAQLTKLLISKLERFLDPANAKPSQVTAIGNKSPPLAALLNSSGTTSSATSVGGTETPSGNNSSSRATSVDSTDRLAMVDEDRDDADMNLRAILSSYTGISAAEIAHDANIGDLGVDSLAAVELTEELQARFGKEVEAEDLLTSSYGALAEFLIPAASTKKAKLPTQKKSGSQSAIPIQPPTSSSSMSNAIASPQSSKGHQTALKLLSETSGAPIPTINGKATLQELGIDSLSAVELKGDLEDAFGIEIEDDRFTLESTVQEVLDFLGVGSATQAASSSPAAASKPTVVSNNVSSSIDKGQAAMIERGSPMEALVECEASFDQAATTHGFLNYWSEVATKAR